MMKTLKLWIVVLALVGGVAVSLNLASNTLSAAAQPDVAPDLHGPVLAGKGGTGGVGIGNG